MQKIPKIITSMTQFQNPETYQTEMQQLRTQMKTFMKDIKTQFSNVVGNYEKQISQLQMESTLLKRSRNVSPTTASPMKKTSSFIMGNDNDDTSTSPILPLRTNQFHRTSDSPFYRTQQRQNKQFPAWGSALQIRNSSLRRKSIHQKQQNNFPQQLINQEFDSDRTFHRSRYERQSQRKKQHEQQVVHFLQSHQKNLNVMTSQMMHLIGKVSKQQHQSMESEQNEEYEESHLRSHEQDHHNKSLSQICGSLDHSFVSQKARKSKLKKKKADEQSKKKKQQIENMNQKIRKQRALKNLLLRLRQNANSTNPPQIVKTSKLIPTGPKTSIAFKKQSYPIRKNSKVMINPVPVNSVNSKLRESSPSFVQKRPASILKQSSNILTRSISGISAISFEE